MKNVIITIVTLITTVYAQDIELSKGLGLGAGMISGTGFSYRQLNDKNGFQVTFGIMKFGDDEEIDDLYFNEGYISGYDPVSWLPDTSRTFYEYEYGYGGSWGNIGLTYYKSLHKGHRSLFYLLGAASFYYSSGSDYRREYRYSLITDSTYVYAPIGEPEELYPPDLIFFAGVGIGLQYRITENIRASVELPLSFSNRGMITMLFPQLSVHYYYK